LRKPSVAGAVALLACLATPAVMAQRADDNATKQSDDAFGRSVGNESLGIYNAGDVRGFSPIDAGNVRIEGLYFDRQSDLPNALVQGSAIRVGIAAQSYPFPSPTGILDYDLRRVGEKRVVSPVLRYGPFGSGGVSIDAQLPLVAERFGVAIGGEVYGDGSQWGGKNRGHSLALMPRWRPAEGLELRPFFSRLSFDEEEPQPLMLTAGGALPPKIEREHYFGQRWAQNEGDLTTYGLLGEARLGAWSTRLGLFESSYTPSAEFADLFTDIQPDGAANETVVAFQDSRFASRSGELRATRTFTERTRRHALILSARGRVQQRRYGGEDVIEIGALQLGTARQIDRGPSDFEFGAQTHDEVKQETAGVAYEMQWKDVGEMSLGLQKTHYSKTVDTPTGALPTSRAQPVLKNATATVYATSWLAVYGSYTQGLEESPVAPSSAANRNVAAPALETKQYDAGVRWTLPHDLKLIAGVFNVEKPYFDVDRNRIFTSLGVVKNRGVELSLAGSPIENLTIVAGTRFLDTKVSGPGVEAGLIGRRPIGNARSYSVASIDYALPQTPVSVDLTIESLSRQVANTDDTVEVPGRTVFHLGGRYRFQLFGKPATLRAQLSNMFDRYGWTMISGGAYVYNAPRRFEMYVAADL
jgi:iron complex outermembrane receptor protein